MSSFNLAKKFKPARKAWKSFTIQLKSKFENFSISKTIKNTKKKLISALYIIHSLIPQKILSWTLSRRRCRYHLYHHHHCQPSPMTSFKSVYIDELFPNNSLDDQPKMVSKESSSIASSSLSISSSKDEKNEQDYCSTSKNVFPKGVKILENKRGETSKSVAQEDGLKLSLLSKFRGIDERADEFISKFKEDMKLRKCEIHS